MSKIFIENQKLKVLADSNKATIKKCTMILISIACIFILITIFSPSVYGAGMFETDEVFLRYPLPRYQLDLYLIERGEGSGWFGWRTLGDHAGNIISWVFNGLANILWMINVFLSYFAGWLIYEAFSLDLVGNFTEAVAGNMEVLWYTFSNAFIAYIVLAVGAYIIFVGLLKREINKAWQAILNFSLTFIIAIAFFGNTASYIRMVNDFSRDLSQTALEAGTSILVPHSGATGQALVREALFDLQITQPWLILQYGRTDIPYDRYSELLSVPVGSEAREDIVYTEVNARGNEYMTGSNVFMRVVIVLFIVFLNLIITMFTLVLAGTMIFAQLMFIVFASFLPISIILSMIPTFGNMRKTAILELFNTMMMRLGVTVLAIVTFSISTMVFSLTTGAPFAWVMFLQVVVFVGIFFNIGRLLKKFNLSTDASNSLGRRILRDPVKKLMGAKMIRRSIDRRRRRRNANPRANQSFNERNPNKTTNMNSESMEADNKKPKESMAKRLGKKTGQVKSLPTRIKNKKDDAVDKVKGLPTNAKFEARKKLRNVKRDFTGAKQNEVKKADTHKSKRMARQRELNRKKELMDKRNKRMSNLKNRRLMRNPQLLKAQSYKGISLDAKKANRNKQSRVPHVTATILDKPKTTKKANPVRTLNSRPMATKNTQKVLPNVPSRKSVKSNQTLLNGQPISTISKQTKPMKPKTNPLSRRPMPVKKRGKEVGLKNRKKRGKK